MVFCAMKPKLSQIRFFVHRPFTNKNPCNKLSVNVLRKTAKIALFSNKNLFIRKEGLNLGLKFEVFLTKGRERLLLYSLFCILREVEEVDVLEDAPDGIYLQECRPCCQSEVTAEVGNLIV